MFPAERVKTADIEQLARRTVGLARIEAERRRRMDHIYERLGQLANREVVAGADVDMTGLVVVVHQKHARGGKIVDVQKLTSRSSGSPDLNLTAPCHFSVVEFANQRGQ